jgi:predicted nucleic acid-binding protein
MIYLFDTNVLLHYLRNSETAKRITNDFDPFKAENRLLISIVTEAEIRSIAQVNGDKINLKNLNPN